MAACWYNNSYIGKAFIRGGKDESQGISYLGGVMHAFSYLAGLSLSIAMLVLLVRPAYGFSEQERKENIRQWWGKSQKEQVQNKEKTLQEALNQIAHPASAEKQEQAIYQLEMLGEEAIPGLMEIIIADDLPSRARKDAVYAAGRIGASASPAVHTITAMLKHRDPDNRAVAARALGRIGKAASASVEKIAALLYDEHPFVRDSARRALKDINTQEAQLRLETFPAH